MITGKFSDWEWDETISFYYKDGDVYFVFIVDNSVAGIRELRVYFDKRGRLIRLLEKSNIESPSGVYFIQLRQENKEIVTKKLIVMD